MNEQVGWRGLVRSLREEAPLWARTLPQLPRLVHRALSEDDTRRLQAGLAGLERAQLRQARALLGIGVVLALLVLVALLR